jgi:tetratricopeptide (TPR) repeat protein
MRTSQSISPNALFFIISGDNYKRMVLNAVELAPDDFITKPFSQHQLHSRLVRAHQKRQELLTVHLAFADKRYQHAVTSAKAYIERGGRYSGYCRSLMIEAQIHMGDYKQAKLELNAILAERRQDWAKATLGRVQYLSGDIDQAIETLTESIKESPMQLFAYDALTQSYQADGKNAKALETIKRANELSPYSIARQQSMADLAMTAQNLTLAKETFANILNLSRCSVHRGPNHLCNYIRSLIDEAQNEDDLYRRSRLLNEVNGILFKAKQEEGKDESFDFSAFEGLCHARVHATKGELQKAKRVLFDSNKRYIDNPQLIESTLLADTFLTLNLLGEYEYTLPLIQELNKRDSLDPFALKNANTVVNHPAFKARLDTFKRLNRLGISAYEKGQFEEASRHFERALQQAPGNTGAILNKIQVSLKMLDQQTSKQPMISTEECMSAIRSLEGLQLNDSHRVRYDALCSEFNIIKNRRNIR